MSDKTDPRLAVMKLDVADRGAGIVRVDTNDEALVERIAEVLSGDLDDEPMWSCVVIARRVLAALREAQ